MTAPRRAASRDRLRSREPRSRPARSCSSVEIAASRVLAPYFGNSLFVWGALIGVVLTGLAVGYWIGGTLADRFPSPALMIGVMALGARRCSPSR